MESPYEGELDAVEQMLARRAPYDEVIAALDALVARAPGDDEQARASIAHVRLSAASMYQRSDPEIAQAIERYLDARPIRWRRLSAVLAACMESPDLFRRYVDPLLADADAHAPDDVDDADALAEVLATARRARERL